MTAGFSDYTRKPHEDFSRKELRFVYTTICLLTGKKPNFKLNKREIERELIDFAKKVVRKFGGV